jgi:hypothetical protein
MTTPFDNEKFKTEILELLRSLDWKLSKILESKQPKNILTESQKHSQGENND